MGNMACMPKRDARNGIASSRSKRMMSARSSRRTVESDEELLHRQALALALQQHQLSQRYEASLSRRIDGSMSRRIGGSRRLQPGDTPTATTPGKQVPLVVENLETKTVVLIHGEGFGAWCWYKTISQLEEAGLEPVALDLTGSGIDHTDNNSINTLAEYSKPLIDYLNKLGKDEKVILVGHSCGGASVSYAMEQCPNKVAKAVFVSATMVKDGQRPFDIFSEELASADVFLQESQLLIYGHGKERPPTGMMLDKTQMKALYFSNSPSKDVALSTVSMRPIPLAPIMQKVALTAENYGSVRRYFVQTLDDKLLSPDIQEKLVRENPPHGIYKIKGADHCPFFSKPQGLHKIIVEIAQIGAPSAPSPTMPAEGKEVDT